MAAAPNYRDQTTWIWWYCPACADIKALGIEDPVSNPPCTAHKVGWCMDLARFPDNAVAQAAYAMGGKEGVTLLLTDMGDEQLEIAATFRAKQMRAFAGVGQIFQDFNRHVHDASASVAQLLPLSADTKYLDKLAKQIGPPGADRTTAKALAAAGLDPDAGADVGLASAHLQADAAEEPGV